MDIIVELFSHICGRGRCFVIDGEALPLCQRCLGLYLGAAVTAAWITARRVWSRGAPPGGVLTVQAAALLAAMLGGLHVIEGGPAWRLACGLWTGHVALVWLVAGAAELRQFDRPRWPLGDTVTAQAVIPLLGLAAVGFAAYSPPPRLLWTVLALAGLACLASAVILAAAAAAGRLGRVAQPGKAVPPARL